MEPPPSPADAFAAFLDRYLHPDSDATLAERLDLAERLVALVRFERNLDPGPLTLAEAAHWTAALTPDGLALRPPDSRFPRKGALRPYQLRAPLLQFLLLGEARRALAPAARKRRGGPVPIWLIAGFKAALRPALSVEDVEPTASGKVRFYTNTHFAAAALRENGLLRFTDEEAFKVWTLTPLGTLAALQLYRPGPLEAAVAPAPVGDRRGAWHGLDTRIADVLYDLTKGHRFAAALGRAVYVAYGDGAWLERHAEEARAAFETYLRFPDAFRWTDGTLTKVKQQEQARGLADALTRTAALGALLNDVALDTAQRERLDEHYRAGAPPPSDLR